MSVELQVGMRVRALRMSNKVIALTGTITEMLDSKCIEMTIDGTEAGREVVHRDDVTVLSSEQQAGSNEKPPMPVEFPTAQHQQSKSFTTVNGKPI
jgi:hypothetical protein